MKKLNRIAAAFMTAAILMTSSVIADTTGIDDVYSGDKGYYETDGENTGVSEPRLSQSGTVTVFHTNDVHGSFIGSDSVIGVDKIAALKNSVDNSILVDGGDATQGIALATLSKGEDVIRLMNAAGYDVMAAGNHEFDNGTDQLKKLADMADFPIISANTYYEGKPFFETADSDGRSIIIDKNGVKVGIFALTTCNTASSTNTNGIKGVEFRDEVETAKEETQYLDEQGADVILAITHMGIIKTESDCTSYELAEAMAGTELDAIIDGHSHSVVNENIGDILVAQTGTGGVNLGRMDITIDESGEVDIKETMLTAEDLKDVEPDADVAEKIEEINEKQSEMLLQVIGKTEGTLWGGSINQIAEARVGETNFGSLIADSIIYNTKENLTEEYRSLPVVSLENGGGFRASVPNGTITKGSIINVLPFANTVIFKEVDPSVLYEVMEASVSSVSSQDKETGFMNAAYSGSFMQIGGMRLEYDPNGKEGSKVVAIYLDGSAEPLDRNDKNTNIILASNDYVAGTGVLGDIPELGEGNGLMETVMDYIAYITDNGTKPVEMPVVTGRIKTVGDYVPKDYTAHVRVQKKDGTPEETGKKINIYIDGVKTDAVVGEDGVLEFTVSDGPHSVKLFESQPEVYVNNYSGAGVIESFGTWNAGYPVLQSDYENIEDVTNTSTETSETTTESTVSTTSESAPEETTAASFSSGGGKRSSGSGKTAIVNTTKPEKADTDTEKKTETVVYPQVKVTIGKNTVDIDNTLYEIDGKAYIQGSSSSTMVPLRFVSLALMGADVNNADASGIIQWKADTKTAVIVAGNSSISFTAGSPYMSVNGKTVLMENDACAEIKDERMYIPFRALGDALGIAVSWDAETGTAVYSAK